jgi:dTDP-4-dehydrorhamnose reductase
VTTSKTILVTGANGQLGKEFGLLANTFPQYVFLLAGKENLAIDNTEALENYFVRHKIDYCVNCAAYTAVDKAEAEKEKAFLINADAAGKLATVCKMHHTQFIHISTDYVYDGNGTQPYKETDPVNPVSVYGLSKLKGEELVLQNNSSAIIIRTSWVYSSFGSNFVKTMLRLMKERDTITVVNDQYGCPTYAADLAAAIMKVIDQFSIRLPEGRQVFNYCNVGAITWYDFAKAIKELTQSNCTINPIATSQYPTPAKRPHYSVLDTGAIKNTFGITIPNWKESLEKCLNLVQKGLVR